MQLLRGERLRKGVGAGRRAENEPESRRLQNRPITTPYSNGDRLANWCRQERWRRSRPGNAIDLRSLSGRKQEQNFDKLRRIPSRTMGQPLRLLELYSGIGGMHAAVRESGIPFEVTSSFEINTSALEVYRHNFPGTSKPRNIMGLTVEEMEQLSPNIIMMSPPCQPFTRQGLKRDVEDARTSSFLHFLGLLEEITAPPEMILLENVAGFEVSQARGRLIGVLEKRGYTWQEFLLSPTEVGVPNSRLRYYLLAKLKPSTFCFPQSQEVLNELPLCLCCKTQEKVPSRESLCRDCNKQILPSLQHLLHKFHSSQNADCLQTSTSFRDIEPSLTGMLIMWRELGRLCNTTLTFLCQRFTHRFRTYHQMTLNELGYCRVFS
ncbi:DNA methyltransferase 2 [Penaeus vannamei]|uniref:DNA methyltransferase 2 n=1 Tax=Penaeus vannamei TaxID=6689 RepID=A0A3R7R0K9_PENVA|nr:DNA methyltransferase 2 [Penaeus vannamei]